MTKRTKDEITTYVSWTDTWLSDPWDGLTSKPINWMEECSGGLSSLLDVEIFVVEEPRVELDEEEREYDGEERRTKSLADEQFFREVGMQTS